MTQNARGRVRLRNPVATTTVAHSITTNTMLPPQTAAVASSAPDILTLAELAAMLRVSRATAYRLIETRAVAFLKVGRALRFRRRDVEAYLQRNYKESKANWN